MQNSSKTTGIVIVVIIVILSVWLMVRKSGSDDMNAVTPITVQQPGDTTAAPSTQTSPGAGTTGSSAAASAITNSGTSDAALDQDAGDGLSAGIEDTHTIIGQFQALDVALVFAKVLA